jgi:hypothetical protein
MMKRILKRPMFRMGGDVENVGIMDGMRQRYSDAGRVEDIDATYKEGDFNVSPTNQSTMSMNMPTGDTRLARRLELINRFTPKPDINQFLIDFGLNLASGPPRGNILSTAAAAARDPFQRFMATQQSADKTKAALALEALTDDDRLAIERKAELMANNPKSKYFNDKQGALDALFSAQLAGGDEFKKLENPDVTSYRVATEEYRMGDIAAKQAVPYIKNITKIVAALDAKNLPLDEASPFRFAGRKKYKNGAVYIDARANKLLRYDKGQNSFVDISDQVDLSELM